MAFSLTNNTDSSTLKNHQNKGYEEKKLVEEYLKAVDKRTKIERRLAQLNAMQSPT